MKKARLSTSVAGVCILSVVLTLLLSGSVAQAGTYDVVACYGGPDNSWTHFADPGMTAYDECPHQPGQTISGIIARATVGSGAVGYLQGAYQVFSAPPGASLAGMSFTVSPYRWESFWSTGIVAYNGDFNSGSLPWGCYPYQNSCGIYPGSFFRPAPISLAGYTQVRIEARCGNSGGCSIASTGRAPYTHASISIGDVVVTVQDFSSPAVSVTGGGLTSGRWLKGTQDVSFYAEDNVGIRETRVRIDGLELARRGRGCDYSLRVPCPQGGDAHSVDTAAVGGDGAHTLTLEAVDTAGNSGYAHRTILLDNTPPTQPEGLAVQGGEGWHGHNGFDLSWRPPAGEGGSPIVGAAYEVCPIDNRECQIGRVEGRDVTSIANVRVPRTGEYTARVWLRDEAGNESKATAVKLVALRLDEEAPELAFERLDAANPTRVDVHVSDRLSGVARGEIEIRKRGSKVWRPLDTNLNAALLTAQLDDENLADGQYELRAKAIDRAGNERSTDRRSDGQMMELALPLRAKTRLRLGVRARSDKRKGGPHGTKIVPVRRRVGVPYGRQSIIAGRLSDGAGKPIAHVPVMVADNANGTPLTTLTTTSTGRFRYAAPNGKSRTLRFRYEGTPFLRSITRDIELLVSGTTSLVVSQHFALNGESVTFAGRVQGRPLPEGGKLVELQARVRKRWRTFATARSDRRGRWSYRYRFDGTRGRQKYFFRARVPAEATYPFNSGHSGSVRVTVLGL
jgi:hypothetical protein